MDSPVKPWNDGGGPWNDGGGPWNDGGGPWNDGGGPWNDGGGSWNDMICDKNDPHDYAKTRFFLMNKQERPVLLAQGSSQGRYNQQKNLMQRRSSWRRQPFRTF